MANRLDREKKTIEIMISLYCRKHHGTEDIRCSECEALYQYALQRIDGCQFRDQKPACSACTVHCFKPAMREAIRVVMRYSGPLMSIRHPYLAMRHFMDSSQSQSAGK